MVERALLCLLSIALVAVPATAAVPLASGDVTFTVVVPSHADGETAPTVELYNAGAAPILLDGWTLHKFDPSHVFAETCSVPLDGLLAPQALATFENPHSWSTCSWSPADGSLTVHDAQGDAVDTVSWGAPGEDYPGSIPDGAGLERCMLVNPGPTLATDPHWLVREDPSLGTLNDPCLEPA